MYILIWYINYNRTLYNCFILSQIVGWGETEKGIKSPVLLEASLPYIDRSTCKKKYKNHEFESFVTLDKFCAGTESGNKIF